LVVVPVAVFVHHIADAGVAHFVQMFVLLTDCTFFNEASDPLNSFTNLVGSFSYNGVSYFKPPAFDGIATNFVRLDGSNITSGTVAEARLPYPLQWRPNATIGGSTNVNETDVSVHIRSNTITAGNLTNGTANIYSTGTNWANKLRIGGASESGSGMIALPGFGSISINGNNFATGDGNNDVTLGGAGVGLVGIIVPNGLQVRGNQTVNRLTSTNGTSSRNVAGTNYFLIAPTNTGALGDVLVVTGIENNTNIWTKWATPASALWGTNAATGTTTNVASSLGVDISPFLSVTNRSGANGQYVTLGADGSTVGVYTKDPNSAAYSALGGNLGPGSADIFNAATERVTVYRGITKSSMGFVTTSNVWPIAVLQNGWADLGNVGCIDWISNRWFYKICTNSMTGLASTNLILEIP